MLNIFKLSKLKRDILSGTVMAGANIILMLIAYPIYLKYLGAELYGLWTTLTVILAFAGMGQIGINKSIIKFVAQEIGDNNRKGASQYITAGFIILIIISFFIFAILLVFKSAFISILNLSNEYRTIAFRLIPMLGLLIPAVFFVQYTKGILMGMEKIEKSNYFFIMGDSLKILIAALLLQFDFGVWSLYYGWLLSSIILFIVFIVFTKKVMEGKLLYLNKDVLLKVSDLFHYGKYLVGSRVINMAFIPLIKIMITCYIGLSEVTYFDIAWRVINKIKVLFEKGFQALISHVGRINKNNSTDISLYHKIKKYNNKSLEFILYFSLPLIVFLFLFSPNILNFWLQDNYNYLIVLIFRILSIGLLMDIAILPIWNIFLGLNKPNFCFYSDFIKSIISIILLGIIVKINLIHIEYISGAIVLGIIPSRFYLIVQYKIIEKYK